MTNSLLWLCESTKVTNMDMCRDLKLDNTLLDNSKPPVLKLCDVRGPQS